MILKIVFIHGKKQIEQAILLDNQLLGESRSWQQLFVLVAGFKIKCYNACPWVQTEKRQLKIWFPPPLFVVSILGLTLRDANLYLRRRCDSSGIYEATWKDHDQSLCVLHKTFSKLNFNDGVCSE